MASARTTLEQVVVDIKTTIDLVGVEEAAKRIDTMFAEYCPEHESLSKEAAKILVEANLSDGSSTNINKRLPNLWLKAFATEKHEEKVFEGFMNKLYYNIVDAMTKKSEEKLDYTLANSTSSSTQSAVSSSVSTSASPFDKPKSSFRP